MASGFGLGDRLDLHAALGAEHQQVLLRGAVERVRGVVLLADVAGVLDPDPLHEVALDVHPDDVPGVQADLVGVVGQLDAAGLAAATDLHLRLDDDRVAGHLGGGDGLVDRVGHVARADRDVEAGEVLLALVLEQIHLGLVSSRLDPTAASSQALMPFNELPGPEDLGHTLLAQRTRVGVGDDATAEDEHVAEVAGAQLVHHPGEQREVRAAEQRQPDGVDVFLQRGLGDLLGRLVQTGVDDLEAMVAQRTGDGLGAAIVTVETGLCHDNTIRPLHK